MIRSSKLQSFCEPRWHFSSRPGSKGSFFPNIVVTVRPDGITSNSVFVWHGLGEFGQALCPDWWQRQILNDGSRLVVYSPLVAPAVFLVEAQSQILKPLPIVQRFARPFGAGVVAMGRPVRRVDAMLRQNRAKHQGALQDHPDDVLVGMIASAFLDIQIKDKYVHCS